jgi:hypothetical protein
MIQKLKHFVLLKCFGLHCEHNKFVIDVFWASLGRNFKNTPIGYAGEGAA